MKLRYLDRCLPDYFLGSSLPVITVPIGPETTYRELRESLVAEYESDCGLYPDGLDMHKMATDMLKGVWSGCWNGVSMDSPIDANLPNDDAESVLIYFAIIEE